MKRLFMFMFLMVVAVFVFGQEAAETYPEGVDDIMDNVLIAIVGGPLIASIVQGIKTGASTATALGRWITQNAPTIANLLGILFAVTVFFFHENLFGDPPGGNLGGFIAAGWLLGYTAAGIAAQAKDVTDGSLRAHKKKEPTQ